MPRIKRRKHITRVTVETERTFVVSTGASVLACDLCGGQAVMVTLNEAARISGMSELKLCRLVESGSVHSIESKDGLLFICLASLLPHRDCQILLGGEDDVYTNS